jgi:hypothetical protein
MKVKIELDITPEEAKELFVPSDKQSEFGMMLYDAYTKAISEQVWKHIDPHNFMGMNKNEGENR